jgi:hypothetical protein
MDFGPTALVVCLVALTALFVPMRSVAIGVSIISISNTHLQ